MAGWSDLKGMSIPNTLPLLVTVSFFVAFGLSTFAEVEIFHPLEKHLWGALGVFVFSFLLFLIGGTGAGDSKLATAFSFWVGLKGMLIFLFYTAVAGGIVGIVAIIIRAKKPFKEPEEESWVARLQAGESVVPYGIPIVIGALISFFYLGYLDPENLKLFLVPAPS